MDQPPSSFFDLNEGQHDHDHLFNLNTQGDFFFREPQGFQLQPPLKADHKIVSSGGSCDHHKPRAEESETDNNGLTKLSIWRNDTIDHHEKHTVTHKYIDDSVKWTSSKMRMMRKMIITNPDQHHNNHNNHHHHVPINFIHDHHDHHQIMKNKHTPMTSPLRADQSSSSSSNIINTNNNNINGTIRVCSDCNTTKTPLWRSGPRGPKSLCNACGIRQRKARRAMAAAAANGTVVSVEANSSMKSTTAKIIQHKEKKSKSNNPQLKKPRGRKKLLCTFEDLRISISKNSASFNRVFPQDEKDAAILLMALSYGLVHG